MNIHERARRLVRQAIESTYTGTCDVINYVYRQDPVTKISCKHEETVLENQPCRLSFRVNNYSRANAAHTGETVSGIKQQIKLFLAPDIVIKPGSKIIVTQNGVTAAYKKSGQPSVYFSHQEIILELFDDIA